MALSGSTGGGGPLLRVADLLHDLSEDSETEIVDRLPSSASTPSSPSVTTSSIQEMKSEFEKQDLPTFFEETYNKLNVALTQSGHTWTGLTQELCATLTTADKLVAMSHLNLGQLSQEVMRLEVFVQRGQKAVATLQRAVGQNTDI